MDQSEIVLQELQRLEDLRGRLLAVADDLEANAGHGARWQANTLAAARIRAAVAGVPGPSQVSRERRREETLAALGRTAGSESAGREWGAA